MAVWLYQFPSGVIIAGAVVASLFVFAFAPWATHRLLGLEKDAARSGAALDALKLIGPLTGIFTAFLLLQSVNRLHDARKLVESQAMNLLQLDRSLGRVEVPEAAEARSAVRDYARTLVDRGWPAMRAMQPSPDVDAAFNLLSNRIDALAKSLRAGRSMMEPILSDYEALGDVQAQISGAAAVGLPTTFWLVLALLILLMVGEAAVVEPDRSVVMPLAGYFAALGLLIGLLFVIDRPFLGDQSADAGPIERTIAILDLRAHLGQVSPPGGVPAERALRP